VKLTKKLAFWVSILVLTQVLSVFFPSCRTAVAEQADSELSEVHIQENGTVISYHIAINKSIIVHTDPLPIESDDAHNVFNLTRNMSMPIYIERNDVVVDGAGYSVQVSGRAGIYIHSGRRRVTIQNFILKDCSTGIEIKDSSDITIKNNKIINSNSAGDGAIGVYLWESKDNSLLKNVVENSSGPGIWLLRNSDENSIENNVLIGNRDGLRVEDSTGCLIQGNTIINNSQAGILLESDEVNCKHTISENDIGNNGVGIWLWGSSGNTLYQNNMLNNYVQASTNNSYNNVWDNGFEGNCWGSDYNGVDRNSDGIGDKPVRIDGNSTDNIDHLPLMGRFQRFGNVSVVSNSTISMMDTLSFNLDVISETTFCRMCIPNATAEPPYSLVIVSNDGQNAPVEYKMIESDRNNTRIYFEYSHPGVATMTIIPSKPPPPWLQWWFWGIVVVAITSVLTTIISLRRNIRERKKQRRKVEADFTEDVKRRQLKTKGFGKKYGIVIKPSENLGDALKRTGIEREKKT
jgi:parallel beta-helix repeat protein